MSVGAGTSREPEPSYDSLHIGFGSARSVSSRSPLPALARSTAAEIRDDAEYLNKFKEAALRSRETALKQNGYWLSQIATFDQSGWPSLKSQGEKMITRSHRRTCNAAANLYLAP